jgi:DNA polymerase elongation subunit (family B)
MGNQNISTYCRVFVRCYFNSSYGATLNEFCRFHDPRLGASTTGSGRQITTFMIETIAESLIGEGAPKIKKETETNRKGEIENTYTINSPIGLGPIYSDTDSCYFVMDKLVNSQEDAVACADAVADYVNSAFPDFMREAFFCQPDFDSLIKANREMVARSGIFRAKKKYMMYVADMEGITIDPNSPKSLKTQGSDIKISSTPEMIRGLLKEVTMMILRFEDKKKIDDYIIEFRGKLNDINDSLTHSILEFASVTSVKTLDEYFVKWDRIERPGLGRVTMPAQVRAAINHNAFIKLNNISDAKEIRAGDKIKMLWLKENEHGFTNIGFGSDTEELPSWFTAAFEVDLKLTEQKLIDQKLGNIFEPIGWTVPTLKTQLMNKLIEF